MQNGARRRLDNDSTLQTAIEPPQAFIPPYVAFPKECGCGVSYSEGEWQQLPFVGTMTDSTCALEFRNCSCDSTLAVLTAIYDRAAAYELYRTDS